MGARLEYKMIKERKLSSCSQLGRENSVKVKSMRCLSVGAGLKNNGAWKSQCFLRQFSFKIILEGQSTPPHPYQGWEWRMLEGSSKYQLAKVLVFTDMLYKDESKKAPGKEVRRPQYSILPLTNCGILDKSLVLCRVLLPYL